MTKQTVSGRHDEGPPDPGWIRKHLEANGLSFRDFVNLALYDSHHGYYSAPENRLRRGADYWTSVVISPVFAFALARLAAEFVAREGDAMCSIVDIGCGDGTLIRSIKGWVRSWGDQKTRFAGIDQSLAHLAEEARSDPDLTFSTDLSSIPSDAPVLVISNELFDALPFARLVQRADALNELWVVDRDGTLDWDERQAPDEYVVYFDERGIRLEVGQFADISLEWSSKYADIAARVGRGLIVTFDYGFDQKKLFDIRIRRYGTAAAYWQQRVHRDLLIRPGSQDVTCHINFSDLQHTGEKQGFATLAFVKQARFLLSLGITDHPLFRPIDELEPPANSAVAVGVFEEREAARRLVLPDGIGEDISVLVQGRGDKYTQWSFAPHLSGKRQAESGSESLS